MKIAMIGHKRIPSREGGVEIVVEELATRMVTQGHEVTVYNRKGGHVAGGEQEITSKLKWYRGIRIITIPTFQNKQLNAIVYAFLATLHAIFQEYDVIHIHAEGPAIMCGLLKLCKKRCVVTIHGLDWQRAKWGGFATRMLKAGEKKAAKYAEQIIVLSNNLQKYFEDTYGRKTVYLPNGIDIPKVEQVNKIQEEYDLQKDSYILFLARIVPEKGLHYLMEAYQNIETDKKLVIAGGASHTVHYYKQIQSLAKSDQRIIMTGFVEGQALEELYSNAYVYVLPSDVEGMPISLLEAMSYGNCVLTSDIPECVEVLRGFGYYFKQGSAPSLQGQLSMLLEDESKVRTVKERVVEQVKQRHNWDRIVEETIRVYTG